jgi:hypothetical protein
MKKFKLFLTLALFGGVAFFSACDNGAAEEAAKKLADSLRTDSTMKADMAKKAEDSIAAAASAAAAQLKADSTKMADSLAAAAKGGKGHK